MVNSSETVGKFNYITHETTVPPTMDGRDTQPHKIAICGGGPVGFAIALGLARQGVSSVVLEADNTVCIGSRAACISRRSLEILERLGVADAFLAKGLAWTTGRSYYRDREILEFHMSDDGNQKFPPMINLQQYYIEQILVDELDKYRDLVDIRWGNAVTAIEQSQDRASVSVRAGDTDYVLEADWLVAADGGRSFIRQHFDLPMQGTVHNGRFVIIDIELESSSPTERRAWFDPAARPGSTMLMHRQPDNIWRIDYLVEDHVSDQEALKEENVLPVVEKFLDAIGETGSWKPVWISMYNAKALALDEFRLGRIIFAGDAAHIVPIFGVRGLNGGFDDAYNLAWKLALVAKGAAAPALLDSYASERHGAFLTNGAAASKSAEFMSPINNSAKLMRDAVLSLIEQRPELSSLVNPRQTQPIRYEGSPLNTPDNAPFNGKFLNVGEPLRESILQNASLPSIKYMTDLLDGRSFLLLIFESKGDLPYLEGLKTATVSGLPIKVARISNGESADAFHDPMGKIFSQYGATEGAGLLVRPDGHVCARWLEIGSAGIDAVIGAANLACALSTGAKKNTEKHKEGLADA